MEKTKMIKAELLKYSVDPLTKKTLPPGHEITIPADEVNKWVKAGFIEKPKVSAKEAGENA